MTRMVLRVSSGKALPPPLQIGRKPRCQERGLMKGVYPPAHKLEARLLRGTRKLHNDLLSHTYKLCPKWTKGQQPLGDLILETSVPS
ncbi:unnamed protein product [Gulo gulo]|uniref:Uncharacterized protein n=1 Tax=Gulo gulo TaxID=48420 RepID=A0A9X9LJI8_GULGU|nr:unnamed protein product [Gulo gulo]